MPVVDKKDAKDLDAAFDALIAASDAQREQRLRAIFVEKLDFAAVAGATKLKLGQWKLRVEGKDMAGPAEAVRVAQRDGVHVVWIAISDPKLRTRNARAALKAVVDAELGGQHLIVLSGPTGSLWHLVWSPDPSSRVIRRMVVEGGLPRRTVTSQLAQVPDLLADLGAPAAVNAAFDVEAVTDRFFEQYSALFHKLEAEFLRQSKDRKWAHDYALQLLNRVMFLYFIDRKGWLESEFLKGYWKTYRGASRPNDTFFTEWMEVLFFEAFTNTFSHPQYMPQTTRTTLADAPYLNGGLYAKGALDTAYTAGVTDKLWQEITDFFDRYNFTIRESTPWELEVAVDPEMIGKVYESLVNVSELDTRSAAGIFYTPRVEIDLMCRLALTDFLVNHLGEARRPLLYEVVFAREEEEKSDVDRAARDENLWPMLNDLLRCVTVVDPAVGSGSFLVGMLKVLDDLIERAKRDIGGDETPAERRRHIIGQSLYGVDAMEWAVGVAELRLWLQLVVETDIPKAERKLRPLLPNLSFRLRVGDALVQDVGGVDLSHGYHTAGLSASLKGQLTKLKGDKLTYYLGEQGHASKDQLEQRELALFRDILDQRVVALTKDARRSAAKLAAARVPQGQLLGLGEDNAVDSRDETRFARELNEAESSLAQAIAARAALRSPKQLPFVWDIAFVEVFSNEAPGFDVVVGNPPYRAHGKISDPTGKIANDKDYRARLARSVYCRHPKFFGPNPDAPARKLDGHSDLYIYFFFHSLSLLNSDGAFSFITSNAWLDAGYGAELQEFVFTYTQVRYVIDNETVRSFSSAAINTAIVLFSAPKEHLDPARTETRFVMFTESFAKAINRDLFKMLDSTTGRSTHAQCRVLACTQDRVIREGSERIVAADGSERFGPYLGDKLGGKYLRAPEVFWTILQKGAQRIGQLQALLHGERYLNTGGADGFFILTEFEEQPGGKHKIRNAKNTKGGKAFEGSLESRYLVPLLKDAAKDERRIDLRHADAMCVVIDDKPSRLAQAYIKWGQAQGYHKKSVTKSQHPWYKPTNQMTGAARILAPRSFNDRYIIHCNPDGLLSLRFYRLHSLGADENELVAFLNSTLVAFFLEVLGNKSQGEGVLDFHMTDFLRIRMPIVLSEDLLKPAKSLRKRKVGDVWNETGISKISEWNQNTSPSPPEDRRQLDDVIFDAIGLTPTEREDVYRELARAAQARLTKAKSVSGSLG